jgi:hypothetical protein
LLSRSNGICIQIHYTSKEERIQENSGILAPSLPGYRTRRNGNKKA